MPWRPLAIALLAAGVAAGCGGGAQSTTAAPVPDHGGRPPARAAVAQNEDWPLFGITADRANASRSARGLSAGTVGSLRRIRLQLPGTVDSSPIYLHAVRAGGATRDVFFVTTTYGRTLALDARNGRLVWQFTPPGIGSWQGGYRITNASPAADPGRRWVFAASPDGLVHKLSVADGHEARSGGWPVRVTRDPTHEKLTSSFNVSGRLLIVATGGYIGDAPPYQGHVVTIDRASGRIEGVFNSLCSNRRRIIAPSTCPSVQSAIWSRSGAAVEPRTHRLLLATGNGSDWNGHTDWPNSALLLSPTATRLLGHWTPPNEAALSDSDTDVGSTGPALLGGGLIVQSGKDARIRVLSERRLRAAGARPVKGGELQSLPTPGGQGMFTAPAVWHHGGRTTMFATTGGGTAAYALRGARLHVVWQNGDAGTSPVVVGSLLLVQDPGGGLDVYRAGSGRHVARLDTGGGHWQSPVVGGGRILVAEGDANSHSTSGSASLFVP
ncbi:MAG TPA: PQQ-binding-like beta-propeller repeat protein [Solirubrobacteraceae bacterium]|nr:PQQ-binding-like beta-propeller repeat protein [Solirubrobacteraceae bacterium]